MRATEFIVEYKKYPTQEYEGVTFTMAERDGQLVVKALNDFGLPMGHVVFNMDGKLLDPQDLSVSSKYQGQGIARVMYDYIKSLGFTIERSSDQTKAGRGFWNKHRGEDARVWEGELDEIARMPQRDFAGGKKALQKSHPEEPQNTKPLPGGSRFTYNVDNDGYHINIFDPASDAPWDARAQLLLTDANIDGIPEAVKVEQITVDEDYRGQGLAKALYGIVLSIMHLPLIAGDTQTPGGRRMWQMLHDVPGVEIQGLWAISKHQLDSPDVKKILAQPGMEAVGHGDYYTFVAFPIGPGKKELKSMIQGLPLYHGEYNGLYTTMMLATWQGASH